jgi:hypothetical protein
MTGNRVPDGIEYMHYEARLARLGELAGNIVEVLVTVGHPMRLTDFFDRVAKSFRLPMSQVKYGLTYAKSSGQVTVDGSGMVALAANTRSAYTRS